MLTVLEALLLIEKMKTTYEEIKTSKYKHNKTSDALRVEFVSVRLLSNVIDYRDQNNILNIFNKRLTLSYITIYQILNTKIKNKFISDAPENELENSKKHKLIFRNHANIKNQIKKMGDMTKL